MNRSSAGGHSDGIDWLGAVHRNGVAKDIVNDDLVFVSR